jgi:hypothetical protein
VSPRRLRGWEPAEVTFFERGKRGRVESVVTLREPEFSPDDVALLLASRLKDARPRGQHGVLLSEATDPGSRGQWEVPAPTTDFAQQALNRAQDEYKKRWGDRADMSVLLWHVTRRGGQTQ